MAVPERGRLARRWIAAHPQSTAALVDDELWVGAYQGHGADRHRPITRLKSSGAIVSAILEPIRPHRQRDIGLWSIVWAVLWGSVALISIPSADSLGPYLLIPFTLYLVFQFLPGVFMLRKGKRDRRRIVPMKVVSDDVEADGVHRLEIRDIDGSRYDILATELLALTLLLSSDFDGEPQATTLETGPDRERSADEMAAAPVIVDAQLLRKMYEPESLERQLARAATVAGTTREQLEARWKEALIHHRQRVQPGLNPPVSNPPNHGFGSWLAVFGVVVQFPLTYVIAFGTAVLLEG